MPFEFLNQYILKRNEERTKIHSFYRLEKEELENISSQIFIPSELKLFYSKVGHGYMFDTDEYFSIDRFLSPEEFKKINLKEDYYKFDPTLEYFDFSNDDSCIFFEVNEGVYLLISKKVKNGKNAIYYFDKKIADSLEEFLIRFDKEGHYFEEDELS